MEEASEKVSIEAEDSASFVIHELEALQSIYVNEIEIKEDEESTSVSIDLNPATADNREEQYVKITLKFDLNKEYPNCIPEISIRNPRGLSDEKLSSIIQDLKAIAESKIGSSMLFEIIEAAKEHLTNENRPCGECAICLYGFSDDDVFTKTECYHYFHSHCLARYVKNASSFEKTDDSSQDSSPNKEILCPMCRLIIHFNGSEDLYPPPSAKEDEFIIDEELLTFQKKMADIYQKQVEKGGIIDIEAEKNKYLLEISNAPTRGNSAEKAISDQASDVDATPETDSSTKIEGNASVVPKDRASGSKDMHISSGNESRNKDARYDGRTKNDRYGYNKQSRGNSNRNNSYRGNQRFNRYPKSHAQNFNRFKYKGGYSPERFDVEEQYTEGDYLPQNKADSEDYSTEAGHDTSPVTDLSPRPRSYIPSNKRNERTNYYDSNRKYDGEKKGNFYHRSNSDTRGKRYGPNSYEKYNYKNQNYQDARSQNYDSEVNNKSDCGQISNESFNEASESISPNDKECFQNNQLECDDKGESKRQDICAGNSSNGELFERQRRNAIRSDTRFQDGRRDSFKRGRQNRGYRNQYNERQHPSSYRENNYQYQGGKFAQENHSGRNYNRRSRGNFNRYSRDENLHYANDKRDYNRSDFSDPSVSNERNPFSERSREFSEKNEQFQRSNNYPQESYLNKSSRELDGNYAENGYRHSGRNRGNSNYQNRSYNSRGSENNKYNSDKSSYPDGRNTSRQNTPRKYNKYSDIRSNKGSEESGTEFQVNSKSENHVNEESIPESISEGAAVPKTDLNEESCESPCDEANVPEEKTPILDSKKVQPPPGFSNPLKKVVYGLQAANPPPGFPRS